MAGTSERTRTDPVDADAGSDDPSRSVAGERRVAERELRAMGTEVHVIVVGAAGAASDRELTALLDRAGARIEQLEQRWSRFRPDSEISRLNAAAGAPVTVSADTMLLLRTAIAAHRESGGAFDPLMLDAVVAAGYDRSFDELPTTRRGTPQTALPSFLVGCEDIELDGTTARLPAGTGFDPGGIGKGLAADLVSADLVQAGAAGACVNMGGDVRVRGAGPDGDAWTIAVEHPHLATPIALLGLRDGAAATSTTLKRRWVVDGQPRHHLIDPATRAPSTTDIELATAVCAEGWQAEVMAKAVLLRGATHPFDLVDGCGAEALVVTDQGAVLASQGLGAFTGAATLPRRIERLERLDLLDPTGPLDPAGPLEPSPSTEGAVPR